MSATHNLPEVKARSSAVKMGNKNPAYIDGRSKLPYPSEWTEALREFIRNRDNRVCQLCNKIEKENGRKLDVHHIDYDKDNCDPINLITLCVGCNTKVNYNREQWKNHFQFN